MASVESTLYDTRMDEFAGTCFLTQRQRDVHTYIKTYFRQFREAPTRQQIQEAMGFKSPNAAQYFVEVLAKKGALSWEPGKFRGIVPQSAPQPDSDVRYSLHY